MTHTKTLWIKEEYLRLIRDGRKTVEIRVGYHNIRRLQPGDHLLLNEQYRFAIKRIDYYLSIEEMLENENPSRIAPDTPEGQLLDQIRAIYPPEKEKLGIIALELEQVRELRVRVQYEYEPELITYLKSLLQPNIALSIGKKIGDKDNYHVLVAGRPERRHIEASPNLDTLIIPWVGIPPDTRELLSEYPSISVHNLHHNAAPTAELAITLLLAAAKFVIPYDQTLRRHDWTMRYQRPGPSKLLSGHTVLILGYGEIGRRVARACFALDMTVLVTKRRPKLSSDEFAAEIHPPQYLVQLLPRASVLIICLPLTPQTDNLITEKELALLSPSSILVNVGRGPIVDEAALFNALQNGQLSAAGLDVWYNYPPDKASRTNTPAANYPFHELDNVVMSPHRAGDTSETDQLRMIHLARLLNAKFENIPVPNKVDLRSGY